MAEELKPAVTEAHGVCITVPLRQSLAFMPGLSWVYGPLHVDLTS